MEKKTGSVVVAQMRNRERKSWTPVKKKKSMEKRLRRNATIFAAVFLCLGAGMIYTVRRPERIEAVMNHVTAGFEYDDTLGRLQYVSNILPESAMVFLQGGDSLQRISAPTHAAIAHAWTQEEPWLEYACLGDVNACCDGEVMTIVRNRENEYTVRILHKDGYESVYSGLNAVCLKEQDSVSSGQQIGTATGFAAFEWRKEGLSVQPVFAEN